MDDDARWKDLADRLTLRIEEVRRVVGPHLRDGRVEIVRTRDGLTVRTARSVRLLPRSEVLRHEASPEATERLVWRLLCG